MPIYLEYLGYSVAVIPGEIVVGREVSCALRFNDEAVSRRHCKLSCTGDALFIEDLGSMNGTLVNDKPLEVRTRTEVHDRDSIEIGGYRLKVRFVEEEEDGVSTRRLASLLELGNLKRPRRPATPGRFTGSFRTAKPTLKPPERRRHHRQSIELSLVYSSDALEIEVMTRDLSVSGVFVCTEVLDPVDTECELQILLDGAPPLHVRGIVRRVVDARQDSNEPAGLGIEFVALGEREQSWIESAIQREIMTGPLERID